MTRIKGRFSKGLAVLLAALMVLAACSGCSQENQNDITYSGNWKIIRQTGKSDVKVLNLPDVRQSTPYTCGVSALQAVLFYYGIQYREGTLAEYAGTTAEEGTPPDGIEKAVNKVNGENNTKLTAEVKQNASISDIEKLIDAETPVIVDLQAWKDADNKAAWKNDWIDGHYVVAIGYDSQNLYFEDPSLMGSVGSIPQSEFLDRWHDYKGTGAYDPKTSITVSHLIVIIKGEKPQMAESVLPID